MVTYKEIQRLPGYRFGDDGSVWSCHKNRWGLADTWRQLTNGAVPVTPGYMREIIHLGRGRTFYVHHLILEAFVEPRPPGKEACHRDGNATNNRLENLYWGTRAENLADKARHQRHYNMKLTPGQVVAIRQGLAMGITYDLLSRLCEVSQATISAIAHDARYMHIVNP